MDKIKVKYHNPICTIEKIRVGDWIDLKSAETIEIREGDTGLQRKEPAESFFPI